MAESVVSFLVQKLNSLILLKNVGKEIVEIRDEFMDMQAPLRYADAMEEEDETVKAWVKQVRDVAYQTVDVIDDFVLLHQQVECAIGGGWSSIIYHQLQSISHNLKNLKKRRQIAKQIQGIKSRVKEIAKRKEDYGVIRWEIGSTSKAANINDPRQDALFLEEAEIVGIHKSRAKLIGWLVDDEHDSSLSAISVYGEGGLGKTTLVKKVFDSQIVMSHFPCRAWITVSQSYDIKDLLRELIKQLLNEEEEMNPLRLKDMLRNRLRGKRYVVVLDDIWKLDAWNDLKNAFPDEVGCGSRIMVTTRFHDIAHECIFENHGHEFKLPYLEPEDSLKLFCKKVFASDDVNSCLNSSQLRDVSQNFLRKCNGLPLAVVSVAGFLRTKDPVEWDQVYKNLGYLMGSSEKFKDLNLSLSLSYMDLPYHLKSCFLFLSIFPEDYVISCLMLLRLWVAEGFVDEKPGISSMSKEDMAKGYLDELVSRSLVQTVKLSLAGKVLECRVHEVLREFIILKAHEQNFVSHIDKEGLKGQTIRRRLSILDTNHLNVFRERRNLFSRIQSFFAFAGCPEFERQLFAKMKNIVVIQLQGAKYLTKVDGIDFLKGLGGHKQLRYLSIQRFLGISELPDSIGSLTNVEILDLRSLMNLKRLPSGLKLMTRLTYLDVLGCSLEYMPNGLKFLLELEVLKGFVISGCTTEKACSLGDLVGLKKLRKLSIYVVRNSSVEETEFKQLKHFQSLRSLQIIWSPMRAFAAQATTSPISILPHGLEKLDLQFFPGSNAGSWLRPSVLFNLKRLYIVGGKLETLAQEDSHSWKVKILRLGYLDEFQIEWLELLNLFPNTVYIEKVDCDKVNAAPVDGVWERRTGMVKKC